MAKRYFRVEKQFTGRIGTNTVAGHPKHPDPRGRVIEADSDAVGLNKFIDNGSVKEITPAQYRKELEQGEVVTAGENAAAQVAGKHPKASITMSDSQLDAMAGRLNVKRAAKSSRGDYVKAINEAADKSDTSADDLPEDRFAATSGESRDTTLHPARTGTQSDVTDAGTADQLGFSTSGVVSDETGTGVEDNSDAAPTGSEGSGDGGKTGGEAGK